MMRAQFSSVVLMAFALALAPIAAAFAEPITGRATVIDGDTLEIRGERLRLQGVDAPEGKQLCRGASPESPGQHEAAIGAASFSSAVAIRAPPAPTR